MKKPPLKLEPFYGPERGFSFTKEIQPILDRQCVRCHNDRDAVLAMEKGGRKTLLDQPPDVRSKGREKSFSLLGEKVRDESAGREWSDAYLTLTQSRRDDKNGEPGPFRGHPEGQVVKWISSQSVPSALPPRFAGSTKSPLMELLEKGHYDVRLSRGEFEKLACWIDLCVPFCGDYTEANIWTRDEKVKYERYAKKRREMDKMEQDVVRSLTRPN